MRALAVAIAAAVLASAASAATTSPRLRLDRSHPLVVAGSSFRAGERVKVVAHAARLIVVHVRATRGAFTAHLGVVPMPSCGSVLIVASGSLGSHARLLLRRPGCPPPSAQ